MAAHGMLRVTLAGSSFASGAFFQLNFLGLRGDRSDLGATDARPLEERCRWGRPQPETIIPVRMVRNNRYC